jgi:hypothetical protein
VKGTAINKTKALLDEASYYTGVQSGQNSPETISAYEYQKDQVPTLDKIAQNANRNSVEEPQDIPFPLQTVVQDLANAYLMTREVRDKFNEAKQFPLYKGREEDLEDLKNRLNGILVEYKKIVTLLEKFTLAARGK